MTLVEPPSNVDCCCFRSPAGSPTAMSARGRQSFSDPCERVAPTHLRDRRRPPSPVPPKTPSATGYLRLPREPSTILKSP